MDLNDKRCLRDKFHLESGIEGDAVTITGDWQCRKAAAGESVVGTIYWHDKLPGDATINLFSQLKIEGIAAETLTAGDIVKVGAPGTDDVQRFAKFVEGTDAESLKMGWCANGGSENGTVVIFCR